MLLHRTFNSVLFNRTSKHSCAGPSTIVAIGMQIGIMREIFYFLSVQALQRDCYISFMSAVYHFITGMETLLYPKRMQVDTLIWNHYHLKPQAGPLGLYKL